LLPRNLSWRQSELELQATFPQRQLLVVVQAPTPELTQIATAKLTRELEPQTGHFVSVRQARSGAFFARNGLLFLSTDQVQQTTQQLRTAGPLLAVLAGDPSLRGAMQALSFGIRGVEGDRFPRQALDRPIAMLTDTLGDVLAGRRASFS